MVVECLVQRLLEELKQSNVTLHIFKFGNLCPQLITMDDFMQLFVPILPMLLEISISQLNSKNIVKFRNCRFGVKNGIFTQKFHFYFFLLK